MLPESGDFQFTMIF